MAYLREYIVHYTKPEQVWLFPSKTAANGHMVEIGKPFRRIVKKAGLDPALVVRHTLRHTAITHLVQAGVDLPTVKKISGHKTLTLRPPERRTCPRGFGQVTAAVWGIGFNNFFITLKKM